MANIANIKDAAKGAVGKVSEKIPGTIKEGELTKKIEEQTAKVPSMTFLLLALGSIGVSAGLALFAERKELASFVGQWVPTFMLLGIYNKLVKLEGSDVFSKPHEQQYGGMKQASDLGQVKSA